MKESLQRRRDELENNKDFDVLFNKYSFADFKWIKTKDIIVSNWVRIKCTYGCPDYGKAACPPNVPSVSECKDFIAEYNKAIVFRFNFEADKDNYPKSFIKKIRNNLLKLERDIFLKGYYKVFLLDLDCCNICAECSKTRIECKNLKSSRPSAEAFAVNVYDTVRNLGYDINVVTEKKQKINRYAFMLIE